VAGWLETAASELDVGPLSNDEIDALLDLARDVAHATERRYAPLTAFLLGAAISNDEDRATAVRTAVTRLRTALPQEP